MAWINVTKPSASSWTNIESYLPAYDESGVTYDSTTTFYDGVNTSSWTNLLKPTGNLLILKGMATGMLGPPAYSTQTDVGNWTFINKPQ